MFWLVLHSSGINIPTPVGGMEMAGMRWRRWLLYCTHTHCDPPRSPPASLPLSMSFAFIFIFFFFDFPNNLFDMKMSTATVNGVGGRAERSRRRRRRQQEKWNEYQFAVLLRRLLFHFFLFEWIHLVFMICAMPMIWMVRNRNGEKVQNVLALSQRRLGLHVFNFNETIEQRNEVFSLLLLNGSAFV